MNVSLLAEFTLDIKDVKGLIRTHNLLTLLVFVSYVLIKKERWDNGAL